MQASTHRAAYPHVQNNYASYVDAKNCQTFATRCRGGKLHKNVFASLAPIGFNLIFVKIQVS